MLQRGPWRRPACRNSFRPDGCKIPWVAMSRGQPRKYMTWQENIGLTRYRLLSGGAVRRNSLRCAPFGPPTVSCVLAPARTCLRQAPPTSRGRGLATSAVPHHLPDDMQVNAFTLEKRCKKTSFFTPFQKIEQNGVKSGRFLHRLLDTRLRKAHLISNPIDQTQRSVSMPETEKEADPKGQLLCL